MAAPTSHAAAEQLLRVRIERSDPISGWIDDGSDGCSRFDGWLELISQFQRLVVEPRLPVANHNARDPVSPPPLQPS
ncbi:MAG TPA: hypothetical protein VHU61_12910 [Solirubrobacteraceae bacterium]|jgi:hypothetical protein|nr:hypothetical protein [Solirubrobacteraceae bacterium]